jgi:hypothetical protein
MEYAINVMIVKKRLGDAIGVHKNCTLPSIMIPCLRIVGAKLRKD